MNRRTLYLFLTVAALLGAAAAHLAAATTNEIPFSSLKTNTAIAGNDQIVIGWRTATNWIARTIQYDYVKRDLTNTAASVATNVLRTLGPDPGFRSSVGGLPAGSYKQNVPTVDGKPAVTHPDVVVCSSNWNGYTHWLAHTPFPDGNRERVEVLASHDGAGWTWPGGLVQRVTPDSNLLAGTSFIADPDLVLNTNGSLLLFYTINGQSGILTQHFAMKSSTDGVTWSAQTVSFTKASTNISVGTLISPNVIRETNGIFSLYYLCFTNPPGSNLIRRQTTDMNPTNWGAETVCTYPYRTNWPFIEPSPWHTDLALVGNVYHWAVGDVNNGKTFWLTSTNGTNFSMASWEPVIPGGGWREHTNRQYKPSISARPGNPLQWDVWLGYATPSTDPTNAPWFIARCGPLTIPPDLTPHGLIVPPASILPTVTNSFPFANYLVGVRFTVDRPRTVRWVNFYTGNSNGNCQAALYRNLGANYTQGQHIAESTRGPTPTNTAMARLDLGPVTLTPGDYTVALWADSTSFHLFRASSTLAQGGRMVWAVGPFTGSQALQRNVTWTETAATLSLTLESP